MLRQPLHSLTATEAASLLEKREITSENLIRSFLERIQERESDVKAWAFLDTQAALNRARILDTSNRRGLLHGIPIGVKDVIDTSQMPTSYGSELYTGHRPDADADCVKKAKQAGAIILGKTVTTEFAFRQAGKTTNPHNAKYSPGGSSSGSAAAVADQMVPLAIGTQTAGSIIRPASYCGIIGHKPSLDTLSFAGVRPLAQSFDTLGWMANSLDDIALLRSVLLGIPHRPIRSRSRPPRIGLFRSIHWADAASDMRHAVEQSALTLSAAGAELVDFDFEFDVRGTIESAWTIIQFEGARSCRTERMKHAEATSTLLHAMVDNGNAILTDTYLQAKQNIAEARGKIDFEMSDLDALLSPAAPGEAPEGLSDTGAATFNLLWTVAGTPTITLPVGRGSHGLPLGLQIAARRGCDSELLEVAHWATERLA